MRVIYRILGYLRALACLAGFAKKPNNNIEMKFFYATGMGGSVASVTYQPTSRTIQKFIGGDCVYSTEAVRKARRIARWTSLIYRVPVQLDEA